MVINTLTMGFVCSQATAIVAIVDRTINNFINNFINVLLIKGLLKYLVAKLHGCYPGVNSLPVSQNFFARFFRRRSVADSSRCLAFLLRCNKHKKHFLLTIFLLMFFFTVTTCEWCLYFLNLVFCLKISSTYGRINRKPQRWLHVDGKSQKSDSTRFPVSG